jgi:hypothetical protein
MNTGDYPSAVVYNFLQPIVATWGPRGFEAAGWRVSLEERAVLGCSAVARIQRNINEFKFSCTYALEFYLQFYASMAKV